jgi:hypothetical protein
MRGVVGAANAAESRSALPQRASVTTDLGNNVCAFTYWVHVLGRRSNGFDVVTTIDKSTPCPSTTGTPSCASPR